MWPTNGWRMNLAMVSDWWWLILLMPWVIGVFSLRRLIFMNGGEGNESNRQDHQDGGSGAGATPGAPGDAQGTAGRAGQDALAIPDVAGPLTGWRTWRLTAEGRLASVNDGLVWPSKQAMTAVCEKGGKQ